MNEILKELLENDLLQNIVKIVLILLSYMPIKKMSSNYKNANDLGIITPINELIKIIQESIIWFIIILVEGALLAELIPRKIYCNNTLISLIVLTWAITILVLFFFVALKRLGIKLKEKNQAFFLTINFLILCFIASCLKMKIFENKNINSKVIEYFKCVFLLTVIIECLLILFSSWKKKKYTFYYVRNLKYYLHTISNKEVICSYNRNLNKKNGYTIEKIDEIKQNRLFWEYESDAYLYLRDVLTQNRVKVLQYQEIIDKTAEKLQSDLEVEFIDEVDVPIHYWGVVYIIETFKMKNLDKKLGRLEEKENYKYHIIKTNDKNRYLLLIYNSTFPA